MIGNNTNSDKSAGHDLKPATVELDDGRTLDAAHHIVNDDAQLLHLYLGARSDGIDVSIPLDRVAAIARPDRAGDELFGEDERVPVVDPVKPGLLGALVEWKGEPWKVIDVSESGQRVRLEPGTIGAVDLCPPGDEPTQRARVDDLTIVERGDRCDEDTGQQDQRLVPDGGLVGPRQPGPHADRYDPIRSGDDDEEPPAKHEVAAQDDDQTTFGGEW